MKNFEVVGYFKYANISDTVSANSQKEALTQVLSKYNIEYKDLLKMTVAENQKCLDAGIQPYTMIDFVLTLPMPKGRGFLVAAERYRLTSSFLIGRTPS